MQCQDYNCNSNDTHVLFTRQYPPDCTHRRMECNECGHRWSTYEMPRKRLRQVAERLRLPFTRSGPRRLYDR